MLLEFSTVCFSVISQPKKCERQSHVITHVRSQTLREGDPNFVLREGDSKNLLREGEKLFHLGRGIFLPKNEPKIKTRKILLLQEIFFRKNILIS